MPEKNKSKGCVPAHPLLAFETYLCLRDRMDKIAQLREKANKLPLQPGGYIMMVACGQVIYVGKAKAL